MVVRILIALALIVVVRGTGGAALSARNHRDAFGFAAWTVVTVAAILLAVSFVVAGDFWADLYDRAMSNVSN